jgi:hypothetical protein
LREYFRKVAARRRDFSVSIDSAHFLGYNRVVFNGKTGEHARFPIFYTPMKRLFSQNDTFSRYSLFIGAFVLIFPALVSAASFGPEDVVNLVNRDREAEDLSMLHADETLTRAAEMKAGDMAKNGYFAHTSPEGTRPWFFFEEAGYRYRYAGENLAIHFTDAESEQSAWMKSEKHRENILSPKYHDIGVAVLEMPWEGKVTTVTVQLFGTRLGEVVSDAEPWKNLSDVAPIAVNAPIVLENKAPAPSILPSTTLPSFTVSQVQTPIFPYQTASMLLLGLIGMLEVCAAGIVSRMLFLRFRTFRFRIATPM